MSTFGSLQSLAMACLDDLVRLDSIREGKYLKWEGEGSDQYATFEWACDGMIEAIASDGPATPVHFTAVSGNEGIQVEYSAVASTPVPLEESVDAFRTFIGNLSLDKDPG